MDFLFPASSPLVRKIVSLALEEDIPHGNVTSALTIPDDRVSRGFVRAKESCTVCGPPLVPIILDIFGEPTAKVTFKSKDGEAVTADSTSPVVLCEIEATTKTLLSVERTILNFMQRLSGVATYTKAVAAQAHGITLLDTRKTTPRLRVLEKYAVRVGGGKNHRTSLSDMVLIKNNHIDAGGGLDQVLKTVMAKKPPYMKVEVEVRNKEELLTALRHAPHVVMLDNMNDTTVKECLDLVKEKAPQVQVEISGGITTERLRALAGIGVPCVSMGSLTTHATNVDISMKIE